MTVKPTGTVPLWAVDDDLGGTDSDAIIAVVAHSLLSSMSVVAGAAHTLEHRWDDLGPGRRADLLAMITTQSDHVAGVLRDLVRGLPADALSALEDGMAGDMRTRASTTPATDTVPT
jgi:hypothetical protein